MRRRLSVQEAKDLGLKYKRSDIMEENGRPFGCYRMNTNTGKIYTEILYDIPKETSCKRSKQKRLLGVEYTTSVKLKSGCIICGYNKSPRALHFHHRNPSTKYKAVTILARAGVTPKLKEEISKCDVMCANCHAEHHDQHPNSHSF